MYIILENLFKTLTNIFQVLYFRDFNFQVLNLIILILYRTGYGGEFLGVGGTWNLNEDKNPDAEIVASGVFVGFFIYTSVVLVSYCFGNTDHKKTLVVSNCTSIYRFRLKDYIKNYSKKL